MFEISSSDLPAPGILGSLMAMRYCWGVPNISFDNPVFSVEDYDVVILGGPIWCWKYSAPLRSWASQYKTKYGSIPSTTSIGFFATAGSSGFSHSFTGLSALLGVESGETLSLTKGDMKNEPERLFLVRQFVLNLLSHRGPEIGVQTNSIPEQGEGL